MPAENADQLIAALPKAELHLHLEGSVAPRTVVELAARHGIAVSEEEAAARYRYSDFRGFLNAFKEVNSLLRTPREYALVVERLLEELRRQNVVYAEVTLSVGGMLRRERDPGAILEAMRAAAANFSDVQVQWIFDATRQFGVEAAMEVASVAAQMKSDGVVAFGMGGDELSLPMKDFREVYEFAAGEGLHRLVHAGEIGGSDQVRDAVEILGAQRIGHGIAVMHDPALRTVLRERRIPLEICPTSNLRTGALARQFSQPEAHIEQHPLGKFLREGLQVTLSTDDPAMFHTDLLNEYEQARRAGLKTPELVRLAEMSFQCAFLPDEDKQKYLSSLRREAEARRLL